VEIFLSLGLYVGKLEDAQLSIGIAGWCRSKVAVLGALGRRRELTPLLQVE
jgi:hypothetical protein